MLIALTGALAGLFHVLAGPDHLAAVGPLAIEGRHRGWVAGWTWGIGHASGVVLVAVLAILLRDLLPPIDAISAWSERVVGAALVGVGFWALRRSARVQPAAARPWHCLARSPARAGGPPMDAASRPRACLVLSRGPSRSGRQFALHRRSPGPGTAHSRRGAHLHRRVWCGLGCGDDGVCRNRRGTWRPRPAPLGRLSRHHGGGIRRGHRHGHGLVGQLNSGSGCGFGLPLQRFPIVRSVRLQADRERPAEAAVRFNCKVL